MTLRPSIESTRALGMHASYYNWNIQFIGLPSAISGVTSAELNARAMSMRPPTRTQDKATIELRGHKVYQHGIITYNPIQLVFHEAVDSKIGTFLEEWMDLQWTPIAGTQLPKNTNQGSIILELMDSMDVTRCTYTLIGVWPTGFTHGADYSSNSSDTVKFTVDLSYDYYLYARA